MADLPTRAEIERWSLQTTPCLPMEYRLLALARRCLPVVEAMAAMYAEYPSTGGTAFTCCLPDCEDPGGTLCPHTCPATQARDIMREVNREQA